MGEASGSATVTVAQVVSSVAVAPDSATVVEGDTFRFAATATDANGHVVTAEITGLGELTVVVPVPTTVAVTPDTVVLTALGHTTQLTAAVRD